MTARRTDGMTALRASDAERERVVNKLEREFAAGRLSMAELEQRITAAQGAQTREQLLALTTDLPADPVQPRSAATAPDPWLLGFLLCMFPPAGLVYWLIARHASRHELTAAGEQTLVVGDDWTPTPSRDGVR